MNKKTKTCLVAGCTGLVINNGYCNRHDIQIRRHGKITDGIPLQDLEGEKWKEVDGLNCLKCKYYISNMGRVKSVGIKSKSNRLLKLIWVRKSSHCLTFTAGRSGGGRSGKPLSVAREVAKAFLPNFKYKRRLIFIDGNKKNCKADNLAWEEESIKKETIKTLKETIKKGKEAAVILEYIINNNDNLFDINGIRKITLSSIYRYLKTHSIKSNVDVESIAQESTLKAIFAIRRGLLRNMDFFTAWVRRITINTLINELKKKKIKEVSIFGLSQDGDEYDISDKIIYDNWRDSYYDRETEQDLPEMRYGF